jgi:RNA polymerase sigma-70 factor (ECF subfamily)
VSASSITKETTPPSADFSQVVEHLFRHESGKIVSALTRIFGFENLALAEDVVQEALMRALKTWPYYGVPNNPAAWITLVAKNLAFDVVRREKTLRDKEPDIASLHVANASPDDVVHLKHEVVDDRLRMMFVCCHPVLPAEAQVALALKTLCGFSVPEIARAFLTSDAAIAKRLTRAGQKIRDARVPYEIPGPAELPARLDNVLQTIYLLFNEGYKASSGEKLIREELCQEAIRLGTLLVENPSGNCTTTHALLALMCLNAARLPARQNAEGNLLRLHEQDRTRWDQVLIARGMYHLSQSAVGQEISTYHLEAAISACHCWAANYDDTDWPHILSLYDQLVQMDASPIIALNRAIAVGKVQGAAAALVELARLSKIAELENYYLLHAAVGEFESERSNYDAAASNYRKAMELVTLESEKRFLSERLAECEQQLQPA